MQVDSQKKLVSVDQPYRVVDLTKVLDPATEKRRCVLRRYHAVVNGVGDHHSEMDLMSHLGTHLEFPYHHHDNWKDASQFEAGYFISRGVLLNLETTEPNAPITAAHLDAADQGRVKPGDTVLLDSPYQSEPFITSPDDQRPDMSKAAAQWFVEKQVRCVGWGDGIAIENEPEGCIACHDIMLGNDILLLEVIKNLGELKQDIFMLSFTALPIVGLDSCPVRVVAVEGLADFQ